MKSTRAAIKLIKEIEALKAEIARLAALIENKQQLAKPAVRPKKQQ